MTVTDLRFRETARPTDFILANEQNRQHKLNEDICNIATGIYVKNNSSSTICEGDTIRIEHWIANQTKT